MTLAEPEKPARRKYKSGKSGKPYRPDRLPGVDLRSEAGKVYAAHFRELSAEFPDAPAASIREVATLLALKDRNNADALASPDAWARNKAIENIIRLGKMIDRKLAVLRGAAPADDETADPSAPSLASILAKHAEAAE